MATFNVYAFNEGYELANIMTGMQHFLGSRDFQAMLIAALVIALLCGAFGILKKAHMPFWAVAGFFAPVVMFACFILPKAKVNITDMYSGEVYTLSNIPIGLALPLSVSSHLEWGLTKIIDDNVRPVSSPAFKDVDFMGHARMMEHISNPNNYVAPHITQSLIAYGRDCMLPALANGVITFTQIRTSGNLKDLLNMNFLALFTTIYDLNGNRSIQPCGVAFPYIMLEMNAIVNTGANTPFRQQSISSLGRKAEQPAAAVAALQTGLSSMFSGFQDGPEQVFQQMFLINGIKNTISTVDPSLGLAVAEAETKQTTSSVVAGLLNIKQLNKYRTFLKLFLITILPIIMSFWVFNYGRTFWSWCGLFMWVSLFLPIEAAVHAVYVATSLAELRQYTDPFNGLSMISQPSVLKWATETNAMASTFMLGIVGFSGLIMKICWPAVGQAVMALGASDQTRARFQAQSAANSLQGAQTRAASLEAGHRTNQMLMGFEGKGQNYGGMTRAVGNAMMDHQKGWTNNKWMPEGVNREGASAPTPENTYDALSTMRGGTTQMTLQASQQASANLGASIQANRQHTRQTAEGVQSSNSFAMSNDQTKGFTDMFNRSSSFLRSQQGQELQQQTYQKAYDQAIKDGKSVEVATLIGARAQATFGAQFLGSGVGMSMDAGISTGEKSSQELSQTHKDSLSKMQTASITKATQDQKQWQNTFQSQNGSSERKAWESKISNSYQDMTTNTQSLARMQTAQTNLQEMMSVGGSTSVDIGKIVSQMSTDDIKQIRPSGSQVEALIESNPNAGRLAFQNALMNDIENQHGSSDREGLSNTFREMGQEKLASLVDSGADISARIGGATGGISSAPGLPGQSSGPFSGSPREMFNNTRSGGGGSGKKDAPFKMPQSGSSPPTTGDGDKTPAPAKGKGSGSGKGGSGTPAQTQNKSPSTGTPPAPPTAPGAGTPVTPAPVSPATPHRAKPITASQEEGVTQDAEVTRKEAGSPTQSENLEKADTVAKQTVTDAQGKIEAIVTAGKAGLTTPVETAIALFNVGLQAAPSVHHLKENNPMALAQIMNTPTVTAPIPTGQVFTPEQKEEFKEKNTKRAMSNTDRANFEDGQKTLDTTRKVINAVSETANVLAEGAVSGVANAEVGGVMSGMGKALGNMVNENKK